MIGSSSTCIYDSFTYNLVSIGRAGEQIEVRRNDEVTVADVRRSLLKNLISPGPARLMTQGLDGVIGIFSGRSRFHPRVGLGHRIDRSSAARRSQRPLPCRQIVGSLSHGRPIF